MGGYIDDGKGDENPDFILWRDDLIQEIEDSAQEALSLSKGEYDGIRELLGQDLYNIDDPLACHSSAIVQCIADLLVLLWWEEEHGGR